MKISMRVSLPGKNALTDTVVDDFSIYADQDNVLIKELARGTVGIASPVTGTIAHNLGYVPFYFSWGNIGGGTYQLISAFDPVNGGGKWRSYVDSNKLYITNAGAAGTVAQYYIFYDNLL